jgi:hypothetical protein
MADIDLGPLVPRPRDPADVFVVVNNTVSPTETMALVTIPENNPRRYYIFEDYNSGVSPGLAQVASGTGAGTNVDGSMPDAEGFGWLRNNLGTTATGRVGQWVGASMRLGNGYARHRSRHRFLVLSDGVTAAYTFRTGFLDSMTAESTDGAFFRYTHSVNGGRFQAVCRSNGSETGSVVDTGVTAAIDTSYIFEVIVNAAGTEALFYIDGTLVATITTNIPTGSGRETSAGYLVIRSVGTGATTPFWTDYQLLEYYRPDR